MLQSGVVVMAIVEQFKMGRWMETTEKNEMKIIAMVLIMRVDIISAWVGNAVHDRRGNKEERMTEEISYDAADNDSKCFLVVMKVVMVRALMETSHDTV